MKIINLTPHEIKILDENGNVIAVFPPSGKVARVCVKRKKVGEIDGIPVYANKFGEVEGLPDTCENCELKGNSCPRSWEIEEDPEAFREHTRFCPFHKPTSVYIVSSMVLQRLLEEAREEQKDCFPTWSVEELMRTDVVSPDTSPANVVRDSDGRIVGVKGFRVV